MSAQEQAPEPGKKPQRDHVPVGRIFRYYGVMLKKYRWPILASALLTVGSAIAMSILSPLALAKIIDKLVAGDYSNQTIWADFLPLIFLFVGSLLAGEVIYRFLLWIHWKTELKAFRELDLLCFDALAQQSMRFHNNRFGGQLVSHVKKFVGAYEMIMDELIFYFLPLGTTLVLTMVVLFPIIPLYALILLGVLVVMTVFIVLFNKKSLAINHLADQADTEKSGRLADMITNVMTVKSYARESYERQRYKDSADKSFEASFVGLRFTTVRQSVSALISVIVAGLVITFTVGGNQWFGISVGTVILLYTYTNNILNNLWELNSALKHVNRALGEASDMTEILDETPTVVDHGGRRLEVGRGKVEFRQITFTHDGAVSPCFADFTLTIKPGERVGLVGVSGSGKTTLTKLLLRFDDVDAGEILIDGQNIREVTQNSLREQIAYVPQESTLFHRSLRENIAYGRQGAGQAEIERAAELAHAHEFIVGLAQGYETLVGERGVKLSGGQRQRVAIARAILKDAPILLLDEATSALDSESEAAIQAALKNLMRGRTSLVIAHRLSTVMDLDRIIVLGDGRIMEDGSHAELLQQNGQYAALWQRQSGGYLEE